jgi:stress response protein YsnF
MTPTRSKTKQSSPRRRAPRRATPSRSTVTRKDPNGGLIVPIAEERVHVSKTQRKMAQVRVRVVPQERIETVDVPLICEKFDVRRVPVNRVVGAATPVRQEGDVTIVPVFEETLVIEKKLVLREEIHIRRRETTRREARKVPVRAETVEIIRSKLP